MTPAGAATATPAPFRKSRLEIDEVPEAASAVESGCSLASGFINRLSHQAALRPRCARASVKRVPTLTMALMTGSNSCPSSDSEYSTEGGEEGMTWRTTTPRSSSPRSRAVNILGEMRAISRRSSPKRRGPPLSFHTTSGVQAPDSSFMQLCIGQPGGGGGAALLRTLSPIRPPDPYGFRLVTSARIGEQRTGWQSVFYAYQP